MVEEMQQWPEGRVCALTDLHAEVWDRSENLALNRQVGTRWLGSAALR